MKMYHYTESGLDNVWLANGFQTKKTPYGQAVSVIDADALHEVIALSLTEKPGRMTGKEFRFLRSQLGLSQGNLAKMMAVTEQSISLWERTGKVPKLGDAALRVLVLEKLRGDGRLSAMIERTNAVDRLLNQRIVARARLHKWTAKSETRDGEAHAVAA